MGLGRGFDLPAGARGILRDIRATRHLHRRNPHRGLLSMLQTA
jgi:hypothetical protein